MANRVHFSGTCPQCGRPTKIYSTLEVRLCRGCVLDRPKVGEQPKEQLPLPTQADVQGQIDVLVERHTLLYDCVNYLGQHSHDGWLYCSCQTAQEIRTLMGVSR